MYEVTVYNDRGSNIYFTENNILKDRFGENGGLICFQTTDGVFVSLSLKRTIVEVKYIKDLNG